MNNTIEIHETAFVTATFRASDEELSKDLYSEYWRNTKTDNWNMNYVKKVSLEEPFVHCLRNRFFYETIKQLIDRKEVEVIINFGCGFSMYPYLFDEEVIHIEIDQREVIDYKKSCVEDWVKEGKLPNREIHYLTKDFNLQRDELEDEIKSIIGDKPSFVILEGVILFLSQECTNDLIDLIGRVQTAGSYFGSVSYLDEINDLDCFKRLTTFLENEAMSGNKFDCLTLPTSYYENLPNYGLVEHEDYVSLSEKYAPERAIINGNSILNENMYLLHKK
ncbi:MAG: class I SAM-dependent methyltransferase [Chitinophagales bacterium]